MPEDLGHQFQQRLATASARLERVSEKQAAQPTQESGWSVKEVAGHLIDSAINNHYRFVRAALDGSYQGPPYSQEAWVSLHGYAGLPWTEVLRLWRAHNDLLARTVQRIPQDRLAASCRIGDEESVSLEFLITDYLDHLEHHLNQICR